MSLTTLSRLESILSNSPLKKDEIKKFLELYRHYKVEQWIYPGVVTRQTQIPIKKVYLALNLLEKSGMVESWFEIICSECKNSTSMVFHTLNDIPNEYDCNECGKRRSGIQDAVLIYKVIQNG